MSSFSTLLPWILTLMHPSFRGPPFFSFVLHPLVPGTNSFSTFLLLAKTFLLDVNPAQASCVLHLALRNHLNVPGWGRYHGRGTVVDFLGLKARDLSSRVPSRVRSYSLCCDWIIIVSDGIGSTSSKLFYYYLFSSWYPPSAMIYSFSLLGTINSPIAYLF